MRRPSPCAGGQFRAGARVLTCALSVWLAGCDGDEAPGPPPGPLPAARGAAGRGAGAPRLVFDLRELDLGEVAVRDRPHVARFPFRNAGGAPLVFRSVRPGCDCSSARPSVNPVPPGGRGFLEATIRAAEAGEKRVRIEVVTDDPLRPVTPLVLAWRASAPRAISPASLEFGTLRPGATAERRADWAIAPAGRAGTVSAVRATDGLAAVADDGGLTVRLTAGAAPGPRSGMVTVDLADAFTPLLNLPVRWTVADVVSVRPGTLLLGVGPPGSPARGRVAVSAPDGGLAIAGASVEGVPGAAAAVGSRTAGRGEVVVTATLPEVPGPFSGALTVEIEAPVRRTVTVPLVGHVTSPAAGGRGPGRTEP